MSGQNEMLTKAEDIADKVSTVTKVVIFCKVLVIFSSYFVEQLLNVLLTSGDQTFQTRPASHRQILPCVNILRRWSPYVGSVE